MAYGPIAAYWPSTKAPKKTEPDFFGTTPDASTAFATVSLPKIPGANPQIKNLFAQAEEAYKKSQADLDRYRALFQDQAPGRSRATTQESNFLGGLYSGATQNQLAGIRARQNQAQAGLQNQMLLDLTRALGLGQVGRGPMGLGSYLSRMAASEAGKLRTQEAASAADRERADMAALLQLQLQGLGRRQALQQNDLQSLLAPIQAENAIQSSYGSLLANALQQALLNQTMAYGMSA